MPGQVMLFSSAVFLFMSLLMCCGSGGVVCAEEVNSVSQSNSVELFKKGETKVDRSGKNVSSSSAHSLVDVNGLMVAFTSTRSNCNQFCCDIEVWSKSLRYEKDKMPFEIIKTKDGNQWMMQAVALKKANESYCTQLFGPSTVVKDNKIYILLSSYTTRKTPERNGSHALFRDLELVVGTVAMPTDGSPNKITWDPSKSLKDALKDKVPTGSSLDEVLVIGRGIVMGGSTILFPIRAVKTSVEEAGNYGCTVIYSDDDGRNWNLSSDKSIDKDCERATLLEWEGKLVMILTSSSSSRTRKVYVSADKGKQWTEYTESDSNLLIDFLKRADVDDISDVIPATISDRKVTLLTQRRFIPSSEYPNKVHLLMTDNRRITSVGPVSLDLNISSFCFMLYTKENGELFALCDKGPRDYPESVVLFSLTEQLERIKSVLHAWGITDGRVSSSCTPASKEAPCSIPMPTSGLIGFLSNTGDSTHWADEYLGVNATVSGGTKVENGFKLSGSRAFIEWEIGNKYGTPLYSFADRGLTLVATVTIHDIPTKTIPLMRVGLRSKTVGLWYGKENHWKGLRDGKENASWEKGKPYQVAITLLKGAGSVYIDGKRLGSLKPNFQPNTHGKAPPPERPNEDNQQPKKEIRHICFGECPFMHYGDESTAASSFTVKNVFLYNRVLSEAELLPAQQQQSQTTAKGAKEATITGKPNVEKRSNEPPAGNDSSVHESLSSLFQLFSLFALLGSATL